MGDAQCDAHLRRWARRTEPALKTLASNFVLPFRLKGDCSSAAANAPESLAPKTVVEKPGFGVEAQFDGTLMRLGRSALVAEISNAK